MSKWVAKNINLCMHILMIKVECGNTKVIVLVGVVMFWDFEVLGKIRFSFLINFYAW